MCKDDKMVYDHWWRVGCVRLHSETLMLAFQYFYLDHGYKRHDSLHVFLQFWQSAQFTRYHFVVRKDPVVGLDIQTGTEKEKKKQLINLNKQEHRQEDRETERIQLHNHLILKLLIYRNKHIIAPLGRPAVLQQTINLQT